MNLHIPVILLNVKVLGVIEAEQTEKDGENMRNDRLVAAAVESHRYKEFNNITKLDKYLLDEIINFFITYNKMSNKIFKPIGNKGSQTAIRLIKKQMDNE
ncbi:MAG: inorganic diphosphatase [Chitinophagaceae bacterium]